MVPARYAKLILCVLVLIVRSLFCAACFSLAVGIQLAVIKATVPLRRNMHGVMV